MRSLLPDVRVRNLAIIRIPPELILNLLQVPDFVRINNHHGINFDFERNCFAIRLAHESFPKYIEGEFLPEIRIIYNQYCSECNRTNIEYILNDNQDRDYNKAYLNGMSLKPKI